MPLLRLIANLLRLPFTALAWFAYRMRARRARWVTLHLTEHVAPLSAPMPRFARWLRRGRPRVALERIDALCRAVAADRGIDGLIVHLPRLSVGWSTAGRLHRALLELARAGKRVVVFLPEGASDREAYVSSPAEVLAMTPQASYALTGFAAGGLYLGDLLARAGLSAQVMAQGNFKTAAERIASNQMSEPERAQLTALLGARQALLEQALAARVGSDTPTTVFFERVGFHGSAAVDAGLATALVYEDGLQGLLGIEPGDKRAELSASGYLAQSERRAFRPLRAQPYLAVVPIHGMIRRGGGIPPLAGRAVTALEPTIAALRRVRADPRAVGVLLHVDSPGGSALVSDLIHHEVKALAAEKPLVAFFADVAASGGYYVATPAKRIVAAPEAITGSIGVISLKLVADGLLDRLGVRSEVVRSAPHADMFSLSRPLSPEEIQLLEAEMRAVYRAFLGVVSDGRGRSVEEIEALAGGRVWSAPDALAHGLVDQLGDMEVALALLRDMVDLPGTARARLRPRTHFPDARPAPPAPAPPTAFAGLSAWTGIELPQSPEWAVLQAYQFGSDRVLCCSLTAMRASGPHSGW